MNGCIVSNTGPLIGLAIIGHLDILDKIFDEVSVPETVNYEMLEGGSMNTGVASYRNSLWIQVRQLSDPLDPLLGNVLDAGEAAVIQLARECEADFVLIDERKGRKIARNIYNMSVIGTARILVEARHRGIIGSVREAIVGMRSGGYRIHDNILEFALRMAGEI
ncbi:MAG: DUF3368 domain-containing protein [Deltaproteobacteria bacterium]|nr:MAG: DUF3368 domain-containing protein [Deltaproteobacteria bacterium]